MPVNVDQNKCIGCGSCPDTCPVGALKMNGGKAEVDKSSCIDCGGCVSACPTEAISM